MNTSASFAAVTAQPSVPDNAINSMLRDLCRPRRPKTKMRVGNAPAGRILIMLIQMMTIKMLSAVEQLATMNGVLSYMSDPGFTPDGNVDKEIFSLMTAEIDRSEHRSLVARERAALRKAAREALAAVAAPSVSQSPEPELPTRQSPAPQIPEVAPAADSEPQVTEPQPEPESPAPVDNPAPKTKRCSDPDTIVCNYRPKKKPLPRYHVLTDEEMNAEPYDPFGARRAYEIQCGPSRPVPRW